jgi:type IV fimbrial biogenesis protein FimT
MLIGTRSVEHGMTLIELLIGIAIVALLIMLGAPSFRDWIQSSQIRNAAESIQNGLQLARTEAVRQNTLVQFVLGGGSSWQVGCVTASETCPANIQSRSSAEGSTSAVLAADQTTITFNGMGRVTPVPVVDININITNPSGGNCVSAGGQMRCLRIVVSSGGQVRMCDTALTLSTTYPQGC